MPHKPNPNSQKVVIWEIVLEEWNTTELNVPIQFFLSLAPWKLISSPRNAAPKNMEINAHTHKHVNAERNNIRYISLCKCNMGCYTYVRTYKCAYTVAPTHTHIHTQTHPYTHTHTHTHTHTFFFIAVWYLMMWIRILIICISYFSPVSLYKQNKNKNIYKIK